AGRDRALDALGRERNHQEESQIREQEYPRQENADENPVGPALSSLQVLGAEAGDHTFGPWGFSVSCRKTASSDCSETRSSLTSTPSETSRRLIDAACEGSTESTSASSTTFTWSGLTSDSSRRRAWSSGVARTRSGRPPLRARSSSTVPSATSLPFAITPTRSQVNSTSLRRWLESSTV